MSVSNVLEYRNMTNLFVLREKETKKGMWFITDKDKEEKYCPYGEVYKNSLRLLGYFQFIGLKAGDKIVLQLPENYDFIHAFWACILGRLIPIPIVAEDRSEYKRKLFKVMEIVEDGYVLGEKSLIPRLKEFTKKEDLDFGLVNGKFIDVKEALRYQEYGSVIYPKPDDIAFIQFSSGSTGMPKGVVLTHENLIYNIDAIVLGARLHSEDVSVSWMPLTHDMGLIGCHLALTMVNANQHMMNIQTFTTRPTLWLEKITEHKATLMVTPNFGLHYSIMATSRKKEIIYDMSSVRVIINGAEPISVQVCNEFLDKMSKFGLKKTVMFPVYGMAEASLAVAFPKLDEGIRTVNIDRNSFLIGERVKYTDKKTNCSACYVEEGYPVKHCAIRICNELDENLHGDTLGLIQIKGKNVTKGYYRNSMANEQAFTPDGWLRTGDVGFFHGERIVVVGRTKEIVIINGQNYFSNDLERIAALISQIKLNRVAVCAVIDPDTQEEKTAVFVVHRKNVEDFIPMAAALKMHFIKEAGVMIDYVVPVMQIPKTSSGKIMRYKLRENFLSGLYDDVIKQCNKEAVINKNNNNASSKHKISEQIIEIWNEVVPEYEIGLRDNFFEYGVNSLILNQLLDRIQRNFSVEMSVEHFFQYTSVEKLSKYIYCNSSKKEVQEHQTMKELKDTVGKEDSIAIIGISALLPGASDVSEYWVNLCGGVESVGPIPAGREKDTVNYLNAIHKNNSKTFLTCGYLEHIDKFDYEFFKIVKKEAIAMSPEQKLFLSTSYSALEDAGYGGDALKSSRTGVYVGYMPDYNGNSYQKILQSSKDVRTPTGVLSSNISGRLSYFMDFTGPSILVDSACSSSMSALKAAYNGICNGDCDQAVVGGVQINIVPIETNQTAGIESSDGHTRPFAEDADGTGIGEGIISILIKPYKKAEADHDNIYAIMRSVSSNQDGHSVGLSAPNPEAQYSLLLEAKKKAGVNFDNISYVEAHGTGTKLGDPIEFNALTRAFRTDTSRNQYCAIGSVKSNIGHLFAASGLASIMKCCYMLKYKKIPATVNTLELNSKINFIESPFTLNLKLKDWDFGHIPRLCGISNFGFSGTNCHCILEEYNRNIPVESKYPYVFVLSALTLKGLKDMVIKYIDYLGQNQKLRMIDITYTAAYGRGHYRFRLAIIAANLQELIHKLAEFDFSTSISKSIFAGEVCVILSKEKEYNFDSITAEEQELLNKSVLKYSKELLNAEKPAKIYNILKILAGLYVRGGAPLWDDMYKSKDIFRINLPVYQYNSSRCWPDFTDINGGNYNE